MRGRRVLGHTLRTLREQAGLRTRELAARAKCSEGHIRNIEGGGDQPSNLLAHSIARVLGVGLDDFTELDDDEQRGAA